MPEKVALLIDANDEFRSATTTSKTRVNQNQNPNRGSLSRESHAFIKVATESIIDEIKCHKTPLDGPNRLQTMAPEWSTRPPSISSGKSHEDPGITLVSIDEGKNLPVDLQLSTPIQNATDLSKHIDETDTATRFESNQSLSSPDVAKKYPLVLTRWVGSWLGMHSSHTLLSIDSEPIDESPSHNCVQSSDSTASKASASLLSPQHVKDSLSPEKIITKTNYLSSWYEWYSSSPSKMHEEKAAVENSLLTQSSITTDLLSKACLVAKPVQIKTGSSWPSWFRDKENHNQQPNNTIPAGSNDVDVDVSDSIASSTSIANLNTNSQISNRNAANKIPSDENSTKTRSTILNPQDYFVQSQIPSGDTPSNIILPPLRSTYQVFESPSTLEKITRFLKFKHYQSARRIFLSLETPKLRKALVIGVHGLFPANLLRTVMGQPTGTSDRFVKYSAEAVQRWAQTHDIGECEIEKVSLEGGGKIAERVENLWKLLLNWINHAREADFILVACHSQGVPVAIILISRLIEFGVVSTGKIGVCAMGPFAEYKSRFIGGSTGELFELADPESKISRMYERSLGISLDFGVRILFCGSIDDQLVSLESSVFSTVSHPYIYRAVFIDVSLTDLVGFALKLRNLGVSDHGLIRELSTPLAGNLYTGEGHSRLYNDSRVYDLAVEYALETTSVESVPMEVKRRKSSASSNPYLLPWIMRGLLEEEYVRTKLINETTELLEKFDSWKPTTKSLKDVKYRLEAVKSKL